MAEIRVQNTLESDTSPFNLQKVYKTLYRYITHVLHNVRWRSESQPSSIGTIQTRSGWISTLKTTLAPFLKRHEVKESRGINRMYGHWVNFVI